MRAEGYHCTETELRMSGGFALLSPDAWRASLEWARFHGIDPCHVPAESTIVRDVERCRVLYTEIVFHDDRPVIDGDELVTRPAVAQGEAPPLPFPNLLLEATP